MGGTEAEKKQKKLAREKERFGLGPLSLFFCSFGFRTVLFFLTLTCSHSHSRSQSLTHSLTLAHTRLHPLTSRLIIKRAVLENLRSNDEESSLSLKQKRAAAHIKPIQGKGREILSLLSYWKRSVAYLYS